MVAVSKSELTGSDEVRARLERELGREGFYGPATEMYHRHPPTAWSAFVTSAQTFEG